MKKVLGFSLLLASFDQIVKIIVNNSMTLNASITIIKDFFNITYVHNNGAAWSLFSGNRFFLIAIAIVALIFIYYFLLKNKKLSKIETITYILLIGGIVGNLCDRILFGYVIDYFDFNIFGYEFPIFNIADIYIVLSVILLFIDVLRGVKHEKNNRGRK